MTIWCTWFILVLSKKEASKQTSFRNDFNLSCLFHFKEAILLLKFFYSFILCVHNIFRNVQKYHLALEPFIYVCYMYLTHPYFHKAKFF